MRWLEVYEGSLTAWGLGSRRFVDDAKYWAMRRFRDGGFGSDGSVYGLCWLRHIKAKANKRGDWTRDKTCRDKIRVVRWLQDGVCKAMVLGLRKAIAKDTVKELLLPSWK
ncbi:hypothetical protein E2542_SST01309 [Spatholobus suberectus]|nr:hypothetical protein E2542_SST01309 [Spatholobus suberectus]